MGALVDVTPDREEMLAAVERLEAARMCITAIQQPGGIVLCTVREADLRALIAAYREDGETINVLTRDVHLRDATIFSLRATIERLTARAAELEEDIRGDRQYRYAEAWPDE